MILLQLSCLSLLLFQLWDGSSHEQPDAYSQAIQNWQACNYYRALLNTIQMHLDSATKLVLRGAHHSILNTAKGASGLASALLVNYSCTGKLDFDKSHLSEGLASCSSHCSGTGKVANPVPALLQASCEILGKPSSLSLSQHANILSCQDTQAHHK